MFNSKQQLKTLSRAIAHLVYRNTDVEDFHSELVIMDEDLYQTVTKIVANKLKSVKRYYNQLMSTSLDDVQRTLKGETTAIDAKFLEFLDELAFNWACGLEWDSPVELDELPQGDLASYILGGRFRQSCLEHREMNDETMCFINKDVNNRIYTLLVKGVF